MIEESVIGSSLKKTVDTRIVSPHNIHEDLVSDHLRPLSFEEFSGQEKLKEKLSIFIEASNQRVDALDHVLLSGPPGLGKTTFAKIIANELGTSFVITSGPAIERQGDLAAILTNLAPRDVLFIDEIHRLKLPVEEILYSAMEDFKLDIVVGKGPDARTLRIDLPPFTLVGATTRAGMLSSPLRDRFGILGGFDFYEVGALTRIIERSARILGMKISKGAAEELARRSRGTPRITNRLLKRSRDVAQVGGRDLISTEVMQKTLELLGVNEKGLEQLDLRILDVLARIHEGNPVGLSTLAISVGEEEDTVSEVCEPYLIQLGYLERTPRGRKITPFGMSYWKQWGGSL